jgi:hypothetical protein
MVQAKITIDVYVNSTVNITSVADEKFAKIIETAKNCTKTKLEALNTTLTILKAQYELCKNPPTTTTTTAASTTTKKPINTAVCSSVFTVVTSAGVKTVCIITSQSSYDSAVTTCTNNGMQIVDTGLVPIALFTGLSGLLNPLSLFAPPSYWVKKSPSGNCQRLTYSIFIPTLYTCSCGISSSYICTS